MVKWEHGGDIYTFVEETGTMPLDLSINVNPCGIPALVKQAMHDAIDACIYYPDPYCRSLRTSIASMLNIPADWIFCGNGAAEVIVRLITEIAPKKALLLAPTFSEYEHALKQCSCTFYTLQAQLDFAVQSDFLSYLQKDIDIVFLCNPNNPTGQLMDAKLLEQIVRTCHLQDIWLVIDECFLDFVPEQYQYSVLYALAKYPKCILLRAFTKMFAVPGVRLGYCISSHFQFIQDLYHHGQVWNVSTIAQRCGEQATQELLFVQLTQQIVERERRKMETKLQELGCKVYTSFANFILFQTKQLDLAEKMRKKGICIRDCSNYRGLSKGYFRIAVCKETEQNRFFEAFHQILFGE